MRRKVYGFCAAGCKYEVVTKMTVTITLLSNGWSDSVQTVNVEGVTSEEDQVVIVSPVPASSIAYNSAGVKCSSEGEGTLTFTCESIPTADLSVNVLVLS